MPLSTDYESKRPDATGTFHYTAEENAVWRDLVARQMPKLQSHGAQVWLEGCSQLGLASDSVPQVRDIHARLQALSGAGVAAVDALIPQDDFSNLLKKRHFPVATFIRRREHFDYIEEPDIFHECFGHCPMLANPDFCDFLERFGDLALRLDPEWSAHLFRLFWFTAEFGLVREGATRKAFGAGIVSSPGELDWAMSDRPEVLPFDLLTVLRTPYRIDIVQPVYFEVTDIAQLADALSQDIEALLIEAQRLGDLPARYSTAA